MTGYHKFQLLMLAVAAAGWIALGWIALGGDDVHEMQAPVALHADLKPEYTPCPKQNAAHKWLEIEIAQGCPGAHCTIYCQYEGAKLMTRDEARL